MPPEGRIGTLADYLDRQARKAAENMRKTLFSAVISAGGLLIRDDGAFQIISADGSFTLYARRGSDGKREFGLLRDNGTFVLRTFSTAGGYQAWALHDNSNNITNSDDAESGQGIARPYLSIPVQTQRWDNLPSTSLDTFEAVETTNYQFKQHPRWFVQIRHCSTAADTTGELRLTLDGVQVGDPTPVAFTSAWVNVGPIAVPGTHMSQHILNLECRRTAGTGRVGASMTVGGMQS